MAGTLYLCATPIGNLGDMTPRAVETLKSVDLIAAEDTRNSIRLLNHFDIHTPMTSYHEYNKVEKAHVLIRQLHEGKDIALITDAGTPAISDPGEVLVQLCRKEGIRITSLPGPAACIVALTLSGLPARRFCFEGFLPAEKKEREAVWEDCENEARTIIFYEAPHHLKRFLQELFDRLGDRKIALCRELTKKFEDVMCVTVSEAIRYYEGNDPRGEYVIVAEGRDRKEKQEEQKKQWQTLSIPEHVAFYESCGADRKEAMKQAAKDRGISRREVYQALLEGK